MKLFSTQAIDSKCFRQWVFIEDSSMISSTAIFLVPSYLRPPTSHIAKLMKLNLKAFRDILDVYLVVAYFDFGHPCGYNSNLKLGGILVRTRLNVANNPPRS